MEYRLDTAISKKLREVYNVSHFADKRIVTLKKPSNSNKTITDYNAYNCACACMDRIDSIVYHCNELFSRVDSVFGLCDVLNYGQTLIDCIDQFGKIYDVRYQDHNDCSCFGKRGIDGKGSDAEYFKYIRSLCSVHPVETNRHPHYQGNEPEWSPWIDILNSNSMLKILNNDGYAKNADFAIVVYRNDLEFNKYIYVSIEEIFKYIEKRYLFIEKVCEVIEKQDNERIAQLKNIKMREEEYFYKYDEYLTYLCDECGKRGFGDYGWQKNMWCAILSSSFEDNQMNEKLCRFQDLLKEDIHDLHEAVQNMDYEKDLAIAPYRVRGIPAEFGYAVEKIFYLQPQWEREDFSIEDTVNTKQYIGDIERLRALLNAVDKAKRENEDISIANRIIDNIFRTTNSEWARAQLRWIEGYLDFNFDYYLSDWYLFLQIMLAFSEV